MGLETRRRRSACSVQGRSRSQRGCLRYRGATSRPRRGRAPRPARSDRARQARLGARGVRPRVRARRRNVRDHFPGVRRRRRQRRQRRQVHPRAACRPRRSGRVGAPHAGAHHRSQCRRLQRLSQQARRRWRRRHRGECRARPADDRQCRRLHRAQHAAPVRRGGHPAARRGDDRGAAGGARLGGRSGVRERQASEHATAAEGDRFRHDHGLADGGGAVRPELRRERRSMVSTATS